MLIYVIWYIYVLANGFEINSPDLLNGLRGKNVYSEIVNTIREKTAKFVEHTLSLSVDSENIDYRSTYHEEK